MRLINAYIRSTVLSTILLVIAILLALVSFMELIGLMQQIGQANFGISQALLFVLMRAPLDLYVLFPTAAFLGCLLGMGRLASSSQLISMRASGVSTASITWSALKAVIFLIVIVTVMGEKVAPQLAAKAYHMQQVALGKASNLRRLQGVWIRHGHAFVHIDRAVNAHEVAGLTIFEFKNDIQLQRVIVAQTADKTDSGWRLNKISVTRFGQQHVATTQYPTMNYPLFFNPKLMQLSRKLIELTNMSELWQLIQYRKQSGLVTTRFEFSFWQRAIQPFAIIIMICLGVPLMFGSLRSASVGLRILIGGAIGFSYYVMNQFFGPVALVYHIPPLLAAAIPSILFLSAYLIATLRQRKG